MAWPAYPKLQILADCPGNEVCLTIDSAVALGLWAKNMSRVKETLDGCPYIVWEGTGTP